MSYTLNYGPGGNSTISVPDGQSGTVANLTFPGRNFSGYGSPVDQNFLSLAENFASANLQGPQYPITGQLWYDIANTSYTDYQGLKVNVSTGNTADWRNLVTFDKSPNIAANGMATGSNPKDISGVGKLTATTANITTVNATTATITTMNATTANVRAIDLNGGNISNANVVTANRANISAMSVGSLTSNSLTLSDPTSNWFTATSTGVTINVPVWIKKLDFETGGATTPTPIVSPSPIISAGAVSVGNAHNKTDTRAFGLDFAYYSNSGGTTDGDRKDAFMGWMAPNASPYANEFVFASSVNTASISSNTSLVTDIVLGNLNAGTYKGTAVIATTLQGDLANGLSKVSIPASGGNINILPGNVAVLTANSTSVTITGGNVGNATNLANAQASNTALIVSGGTYVNGNLKVAGVIYGNVVSPAGSTASMANANISGTATITTVSSTTVNSTDVNVTGTTTTPTLKVSTAATVQSLTCNTSIGTTSLSATAGITATGNSAITSTNFTAGSNTTAGYLTGAFTLTAGSTLEATYSADLAERHHADATYPTGTVMTVGGVNEITSANETDKVLGVVSDGWAYLMNGGAGPQETHPGVAYVGRVPVRVVGPINKHDEVSPFANGVATSSKSNSFGWALETNNEPGEKLVLCIVK
jgi:hypothetical protein